MTEQRIRWVVFCLGVAGLLIGAFEPDDTVAGPLILFCSVVCGFSLAGIK